jgi:hypothetical protein
MKKSLQNQRRREVNGWPNNKKYEIIVEFLGYSFSRVDYTHIINDVLIISPDIYIKFMPPPD